MPKILKKIICVQFTTLRKFPRPLMSVKNVGKAVSSRSSSNSKSSPQCCSKRR